MPRNPLRLVISRAISLAIIALLPGFAGALSTTNSDNAALMLADMALSRGDCRGGTDRYLKAAMATSDATISERANKVAADCQQVDANLRAARTLASTCWQSAATLLARSEIVASLVAIAALR